ncbi:hypothetical protein VTK73DRAFT_9387 [Phialemonium thermophilum]|uniref:DUF6987 domain-containing protein n=1 Tax=Phialemonium thermophilum TaxID=223376 RepID=A0ABR3W2I3_9PEZI
MAEVATRSPDPWQQRERAGMTEESAPEPQAAAAQSPAPKEQEFQTTPDVNNEENEDSDNTKQEESGTQDVETPQPEDTADEAQNAEQPVGKEGESEEPEQQQQQEQEQEPELEQQQEAQPEQGQEQEQEQEEPQPEEEPKDYSILKNAKVNKGGNLVNPDNKVVGRVKEGVLKDLVGKTADENGNIWNSNGKIVGKAEPLSDDERQALEKEPSPFESFPDAVVDEDGKVVSGGKAIGTVVEGDIKHLQGKSVDADGDILDRAGNVIGKAKRLEKEPEPEPEPEPDRSVLAGKRVNKAGNVVDSSGTIFGRVVEGDPKTMVGRMCDKNGNILNEMGETIGKAEPVPEADREGVKEGPFADLQGCTVNKEGKVVTPGGDVVGRLVSGDAKVLYGRAVDEDGDICDKNGNVVGKAERWEEPEVEKKKHPLSGRRVNREGNVFDEDGNLVGKLTTGTLSICAGKEIDDDGDVVDGKGNTVGHVSLLDEIPEEKPEESAEDKEKREQLEKDRELAKQLAACLEKCLDKIKPICDMITQVSEREGAFLKSFKTTTCHHFSLLTFLGPRKCKRRSGHPRRSWTRRLSSRT